MKRIKLMILACTTALIGLTATAQEIPGSEDQKISKTSNVEMYYFHFTRRCATCQAVESVSKESVEELYGDKVKFWVFNLDEEEGEIKGKEIGVSGQSLLIVSGDTKIDITNEGFMNARNNPEKLKSLIKEKIDPLL
jgi:hypothetical protein